MNKNIYRQYDSRWGNKAYPDKYSSFSGNGCGACSVLHCIIERWKYRNYTPNNIIDYLKQYAVSGCGTLHSGIPAALGHFGMTHIVEHDKMSEVWKELKEDNRVGIILFSAGKGPDGTLWTSGGHYIAFTDYKIKNKKHYFYMKDSGTRKHDGWYCYETSMKGVIFKIWTCKVPALTKPEKIAKTTLELVWKKGTKKSKYQYNGGRATVSFNTALNKVYPNRSDWGTAPKIGASCDVAVGTVMRKSGVDKDFPRGFEQQIKHYDKVFKTKKGANVTPYSLIQKLGITGTYVVQYRKKGGGVHTLIYHNKLIYEAQYEKTFFHVNKSLSKIKKKYPTVRILYFKWK